MPPCRWLSLGAGSRRLVPRAVPPRVLPCQLVLRGPFVRGHDAAIIEPPEPGLLSACPVSMAGRGQDIVVQVDRLPDD